MPSKWVELPFDPDTMTDDHNWPKLTQRLRCDRMHGQDFERTRNVDGHCSQSAAKRPKCGNKGVYVDTCQQNKGCQPATELLQLLRRVGLLPGKHSALQHALPMVLGIAQVYSGDTSPLHHLCSCI
jgi:hypothetical protein